MAYKDKHRDDEEKEKELPEGAAEEVLDETAEDEDEETFGVTGEEDEKAWE